MALSPDGTIVAVGMNGPFVELRDVGSGTLVQTFSGDTGSALSVDLSPNGETLVVGSADGTVRLWGVR